MVTAAWMDWGILWLTRIPPPGTRSKSWTLARLSCDGFARTYRADMSADSLMHGLFGCFEAVAAASLGVFTPLSRDDGDAQREGPGAGGQAQMQRGCWSCSFLLCCRLLRGTGASR